jgi:6-pyruvoyltetrahydropterin/6-carboxytetrahydropterin synthase
MKACLTKRYRFAASHRLHNDELTDEENRRVFGKCNNPYGHGHNYALEVTVRGPVDARTGMICDLGELDAVVSREVLERFDHENLNTLPEFADAVPTSEMLAQCIFDLLQRSFHAAEVHKVRLEETTQNAFEYAGGHEVRQ